MVRQLPIVCALLAVVMAARPLSASAADVPGSIGIGAAWYHDASPLDAWACYAQVPVAHVGPVAVTAGATCPVEYPERTRPHLGAAMMLVNRFELGAAWLISPYRAFSLQAGITARF